MCIRCFVVALTTLICCAALCIAEEASNLVDKRVQQVLTMAEGELPLDVIIIKINDIGSFPELSAGDLVALKEANVPGQALVLMIQLEETPTPSDPPPAPVPSTVTEIPSPQTASSSAIRVTIQRPFRITYYEVYVDGELMAQRGKLWDGTSDPGQKLKRPSFLGTRKETTIDALNIDATPGQHEISVGIAVSWVEDDSEPLDDFDNFSQEFYVNRGVRGITTDGHHGEWGQNTSVSCTVEAGQTCSVVATIEKRSPTKFGGLPIYSVSYETTVE